MNTEKAVGDMVEKWGLDVEETKSAVLQGLIHVLHPISQVYAKYDARENVKDQDGATWMEILPTKLDVQPGKESYFFRFYGRYKGEHVPRRYGLIQKNWLAFMLTKTGKTFELKVGNPDGFKFISHKHLLDCMEEQLGRGGRQDVSGSFVCGGFKGVGEAVSILVMAFNKQIAENKALHDADVMKARSLEKFADKTPLDYRKVKDDMLESVFGKVIEEVCNGVNVHGDVVRVGNEKTKMHLPKMFENIAELSHSNRVLRGNKSVDVSAVGTWSDTREGYVIRARAITTLLYGDAAYNLMVEWHLNPGERKLGIYLSHQVKAGQLYQPRSFVEDIRGDISRDTLKKAASRCLASILNVEFYGLEHAMQLKGGRRKSQDSSITGIFEKMCERLEKDENHNLTYFVHEDRLKMVTKVITLPVDKLFVKAGVIAEPPYRREWVFYDFKNNYPVSTAMLNLQLFNKSGKKIEIQIFIEYNLETRKYQTWFVWQSEMFKRHNTYGLPIVKASDMEKEFWTMLQMAFVSIIRDLDIQ